MRYTFLEDDRCHFVQFDSVAEHAALALSVKDNHKFSGARLHVLDREDFVGRYFGSWSQVEAAANSKWDEGMEAFERMASELERDTLSPPKNTRRRQCYSDDCGDEVDLDRLQRGQPFWRTTMREHRVSQQTVTIVTDITTSWDRESLEVLWRGAAAVVLAKMLEGAGYRVELWAAQHCNPAYLDGTGVCTAVCLKQASDLLDVASLINAVSGWYYRSIFFASYYDRKVAPRDGLGTPKPIQKRVKDITPDEKALVAKDLWNREAAITWVRDQLRSFE
jgi:hypothetical protein